MKDRVIKKIFYIAIFVLAIAVYRTAIANDFEGIREAKAVWDITTGDENIFMDRVQLIKETIENLKKRGIKPDFVLVIHGPAAKFVTKSFAGTKFEGSKLDNLDQAQSLLQSLKNEGTKIEVCSIAMKRGKISKENVQSFAVIEDNVFENTIVLENNGYAYMPVH